ncbi:flagellin [Vibrio sp. 1403]|uniref:flagellin n=1 Tax=Vibrio TaxID=662 RepID=UPI0029662B16|nr:flagellin [Vibrio sp. 1403]MDW3080473.1 flagellin [Vibrio sp. 1403]
MAVNVNTNVVAMHGQHRLSRVTDRHATSMERLSSGLKINTAKDDAAGLQISNRLQSQSRGMDVAIRNANDGISMLQTAEGAMGEYTENLMRMRDLTLRYANGSLNSEDREAIQQEYNALTDELNRISETTSYGGQRLLNGMNNHRTFQVGTDSGETISIDLPNLGEEEQESTTKERRFVRYSEYKKDWISEPGDSIVIQRISYESGRAHRTEDVTYVDIEPGSSMTDAAEQINDRLGDSVHVSTEQYVRSDGVESQRLVYYSLNANEFVATRHYHNFYPHNQHDPYASEQGHYHSGEVEITNKSIISALPSLDIPELAGSVLNSLDKLLQSVDSERAKLGATQNRLSHAINNLSQSSENVAASNSQIRDTDFAKETSELTKQSILNQVNTSILAQANSSNVSAMNLLN